MAAWPWQGHCVLYKAMIVVFYGIFATSAPRPAGHMTSRQKAVLEVLLAHQASRARPEALHAALVAIESTQRSALADLSRGRFVYVRMNPAAGLGNRLVAMVSGLLLAAATDRGFLVGADMSCDCWRCLCTAESFCGTLCHDATLQSNVVGQGGSTKPA